MSGSATHRAVSSAVEHCLHTARVTGSIPVPPTMLQNERSLQKWGLFVTSDPAGSAECALRLSRVLPAARLIFAVRQSGRARINVPSVTRRIGPINDGADEVNDFFDLNASLIRFIVRPLPLSDSSSSNASISDSRSRSTRYLTPFSGRSKLCFAAISTNSERRLGEISFFIFTLPSGLSVLRYSSEGRYDPFAVQNYSHPSLCTPSCRRPARQPSRVLSLPIVWPLQRPPASIAGDCLIQAVLGVAGDLPATAPEVPVTPAAPAPISAAVATAPGFAIAARPPSASTGAARIAVNATPIAGPRLSLDFSAEE